MKACGVHLAKPSLGEFEKLVDRKLEDPAAQEAAALDFVHRGCVELLAVTMGHDGAILATADGVTRLPALKLETKSAVGAGDSFVAAMTVALARGETPRDAFVWGMAGGSAAVLTDGTDLAKREDVERLRLRILDEARG
jgi:6-phosphofructokinase 2